MLAFGLYTIQGASTNILLRLLPHKLQGLYAQPVATPRVDTIILWAMYPHMACNHLAVSLPTDQWGAVLCQVPPGYLKAVLKIWQIHNQQIHLGNYDQELCSLLQAAVHQIFHEANQDILQTMIENLVLEEILNCLNCSVRQWVTCK